MKKFLFLCLLYFPSTNITAQYSSLLWKITNKQTRQASFLFGTMHTSDARVLRMANFAMPYFLKTKVYSMELDPNEALNLNLVAKLMMGKNYSLKTMIPDREYRFLDSIVRHEVGFSVSLFDNVAPVFTMTILEASSMQLNDSSAKGSNDEVLDLFFYRKAQQQKKKVIGIETVDEQLGALNALPYQQQADLLVKEINLLQLDTAKGNDLLKYYLEQNLDSLAALDENTQMPPAFYKALVTDRNVRMANRIAEVMKKQATFIALGALHLPSDDGVISLLRKRGFTVEPIKTNFNGNQK